MVKIPALGFAGLGSLRARFWPGVGGVVLVVYMAFTALLPLVPPYIELPGASLMTWSQWALPGVAFTVSLACWRGAARRTGRERHGSTAHERNRRVAFAFLANAILDGCVLALLGVVRIVAVQGSV